MRHNTRLVAIVNVTPDSFSDGGKHVSPKDALKAVEQAIRDGADVIDIGAESTRPGATPLTAAEEWQRLQPVLENLPKTGVAYSVDTYHPENATRALALGVDWINDVTGFASSDMISAVKGSGCSLVVMHSLGVPARKDATLPEGTNPVALIMEFARKRFSELQQAGINKNRLIFDPGIGFGKTASQSQHILKRAGEFKQLGVPLLIGHSRKSFLGLPSASNEERDLATLEWSQQLIYAGVDYLRVHNVKLHHYMLKGLRHVA